MFVPFSCGAVLVKEGGAVLRDAFDMSPEYLSDDRGGIDVEFDFFRYGQLGTRRFNSLKLWMAIKFMGRVGYAETVERQIDLTNYLAKCLDALQDFKRVGEIETEFAVSVSCRSQRDTWRVTIQIACNNVYNN
jgi:glutamate/tyrosine decarboxylase-like PLP-dependent enzyme